MDTSIVKSGTQIHQIDMDPIDLTESSSPSASSKQSGVGLALYDKQNSIKRAHMYLQLQYPALTRENRYVLSFNFGIVAIIHAALDVKSFDFQMLELIASSNKSSSLLLKSCVSGVKWMLEANGPVEMFTADMNLAFDLLRDKHILSVITKVFLLPLICSWFPEMQSPASQVEMKLRSASIRAQPLSVMVRVVTYDTGVGPAFIDIELTEPSKDRGCIDYFFKL